MLRKIFLSALLFLIFIGCSENKKASLVLNDQEYLEMPGLNVMLAHDFYPEGHQGGVSIIQNGLRVATNGDLRLEPTPGQWQPIPKVGERQVDTLTQEIWVDMAYPDSSRNRKGFNPIVYPDLQFDYTLKIKPEGNSFRIIVNLKKPLPEKWIGKVGFNLELFPAPLFGKSYYLGNKQGIFAPQANGPMYKDADGTNQMTAMAKGKKLVIAPGQAPQRMVIENEHGEIELIDGRGVHSNGWFVVRSLIPSGATAGAIEWLVTPNVIPNWKRKPAIQISQVGYLPNQKKAAVIEIDKHEKKRFIPALVRVAADGKLRTVKKGQDKLWGSFLRYNYLHFDFSDIQEEGLYQVRYGDQLSEVFQISKQLFKRHVWQPTLEYFLPIQMCHMRVNDRYRVWHGLCHIDDARMAPTDSILFDGYHQGESTFTKFASLQHVPGLDRGGWHDAGDFDLRVESQAGTVQMLSLALEEFGLNYDQTTIDQKNRLVEMHRPDGKNDAQQQIEHGVLSIVGGYDHLGRLYRGIICPTLRQYVMLGDAANMTDNLKYSVSLDSGEVSDGRSGVADDRLVYTEQNPKRELRVAAGLAAASRALLGYNDRLADHCLAIAENIWKENAGVPVLASVQPAVELLLATNRQKYKEFFIQNKSLIVKQIDKTGWMVGRILPLIEDRQYQKTIKTAVQGLRDKIEKDRKENPYGVPYRPNIWGAGWGIQRFGVEQYFLHSRFSDIFPADYMLNALDFVLGCHPGENNASFASGIGAKSVMVAYGFNRADRTYIPGGVVSGTALIRPDYPELLQWPFLWQQTEYVMGGGATNFMFLVLAADHELSY